MPFTLRSNNPAAMAMAASRWIAGQGPDIGAGLANAVPVWLAQGNFTSRTLWQPMVEWLRHAGHIDAEIDACRTVLSLQPDESFFQLRLAETLLHTGNNTEARRVIDGIQGSDAIRCDALLLQLDLEDKTPSARTSTVDTLEPLLMSDGAWSNRHRRLIDFLLKHGQVKRVASFISGWSERWEITPAHRPETIAAIARDWIADRRVPVEIGLDDLVSQWQKQATLPPGMLWYLIAVRLKQCDGFDAEVDACRTALSLLPTETAFHLRLADALHRCGKEDEAHQTLNHVEESKQLGCEGLLQRLKLDDRDPARTDATIDTLVELLLSDGDWNENHRELIDRLIDRRLTERASAFFHGWITRWPIDQAHSFSIGIAAMLVGEPQLARSLFPPAWNCVSDKSNPAIGRFDGSIRPYDAAIEADLLTRIDTAFACDETALPVTALPDYQPPPAGLRVMMLSYGHRAVANDIADHFSISAAEAGINIQLYLDSALITPANFRGSDGESAARVDAFIKELDKARPDVLIMDCCAWPLLRGLNPGIAADLKARFGFRLVCIMRDAHRDMEPLLDAWLPACDTMVVFDPLSPVLQSPPPRQSEKVIILPVPSLHPPFLERENRDLGMTFVGNVAWQARYLLLSVLMTEDIGFTAVFGPHRAVEVPDTRSYAHMLARSRAVLNVSRHGHEINLVTGRVWETVATGALLVEQNNPATALFFTPYRHYLPWTNVEDIVHIAHFIERRPEVAERIATEAHAWAMRHYSSSKLWTGLLGHATRPRPEADADAERIAAHTWMSVILTKVTTTITS